MHLIFKQRFTVTFDVAGRKLLAVNGFSPKFIHHVIARILGHGQSKECGMLKLFVQKARLRVELQG